MNATAIIIPTYGHFDYAARAIQSALYKTAGEPIVFVIDDASPDWNAGIDLLCSRFSEAFRSRRLFVHHFITNGGLHRSWNRGLEYAREAGCRFACVTNSDVIFSQDWNRPFAKACTEGGFALAGPLTNGPGSEARAFVGEHLAGYEPSDSEQAIDDTARRLRDSHAESVEESRLNGFCLFAETDRWWEGRYDDQHVFCPRNDVQQDGTSNPTPLMTEGEYELQNRWAARGWKSGLCLDSFVFHYRSITRGADYCGERFYRPLANT